MNAELIKRRNIIEEKDVTIANLKGLVTSKMHSHENERRNWEARLQARISDFKEQIQKLKDEWVDHELYEIVLLLVTTFDFTFRLQTLKAEKKIEKKKKKEKKAKKKGNTMLLNNPGAVKELLYTYFAYLNQILIRIKAWAIFEYTENAGGKIRYW